MYHTIIRMHTAEDKWTGLFIDSESVFKKTKSSSLELIDVYVLLFSNMHACMHTGLPICCLKGGLRDIFGCIIAQLVIHFDFIRCWKVWPSRLAMVVWCDMCKTYNINRCVSFWSGITAQGIHVYTFTNTLQLKVYFVIHSLIPPYFSKKV